jgi:hypothetical protein
MWSLVSGMPSIVIRRLAKAARKAAWPPAGHKTLMHKPSLMAEMVKRQPAIFV